MSQDAKVMTSLEQTLPTSSFGALTTMDDMALTTSASSGNKSLTSGASKSQNVSMEKILRDRP